MKDYSKILKDLGANAGIEGGFIVSRDGLLLYSDMRDVHAGTFAAMSATLLSSAEVAMDEIRGGIPQKVVVEGKEKNIVVMGAGKDCLLAVVVSGNVNEVFDKIEEAARKLAMMDGKK